MTDHEILTEADFESVKALIQSRTSFVGIPKTAESWVERIQSAAISELRDLLRQPAEVAMVHGLKSDGQLVGAAITFSSPNQPCWFLRTAYVAPSAPSTTVSNILDQATKCYEALGFKRFASVYTQKSYERYTRLNKNTSVLDRYVGHTDLVVEPNTRPKFLDYWEYLYGRMLIPETTVVRMFTLVDKSMHTKANIAVTDYTYHADRKGSQV